MIKTMLNRYKCGREWSPKEKREGDFWFYSFALSLAFTKMSTAIITKTKPVMPLTSLGESTSLAEV